MTFLFALLMSFNAGAVDDSVACYRFDLPDGPEASVVNVSVRSEVWCYQRLRYPLGALFIFNADDDEVRPELALIRDVDGVVTHASRLSDEIVVHSVQMSRFNPVAPIPLQEPSDRTPLPLPPHGPSSASVRAIASFLWDGRTAPADFSLKEGHWEATAKRLPWRGFWWPYHNQWLSGTSQSPLAKYDRFVTSRSNENPRAAAWEQANHRYKGVWWEGHCNGWAASSVLRAQPKARRDPRTGIYFSVSDQKGLLAETDYCSHSAFFGKRYRGRRGDDIRDIRPETFHKALVYYIGNLGKSVAVDYRRDSAVDNHVISGLAMDVRKTGTGVYAVTTVVTIHKYDAFRANIPASAPTYTRTYKYILREDESGAPIDGKWLSVNPDFLWVPLSPAECASNNPRVDSTWVQTILDLPPSEQASRGWRGWNR